MNLGKSKENHQLKGGVLLSYVNIGVTIIVSLFYTPYLLKMLGQNEFGLFSLVFSVIGTFAILDFGMGTANIRYTAKYRAENNKKKEYTLHAMFFIIYLAVGILALILGVYLYFNVNAVFGKNMTPIEITRLKTMLIFVIPYIATILPLSIFISIIQGYERFVFDRIMALINIILIPLVSIILLYNGYKSISLVAGIIIINIFVRLIRVYYCFKYLKIRLNFKDFDKKLFKEIFSYSVFIFLGVLAFRISDNSGQLILGIISGTKQVAIYAIGITLYIQYRTLALAIRNLLLPVITRIKQDENKIKKYNGYFISVGRMQFYILALVYVGFIVYGKQFIILWAGPEYEPSYFVSLFLIGISLLTQIQAVSSTILQAQNKHQFVSILAFIVSVVNVGLSVILGGKYGAIGIAISFALLSIISTIIKNIYFVKKVNLNVGRYWIQILKITPSLILPIVFSLIYLHFYNASSWFNLTIGILGFIVLYVLSVVLFSLNKFEKGLVLYPFLMYSRKLLHLKTKQYE